jgi:hypothetical protein
MQTLYVKNSTYKVDKWTHFVHNISRTSSAVKELLLGLATGQGGSRVPLSSMAPRREVDYDEMIGYQ